MDSHNEEQSNILLAVTVSGEILYFRPLAAGFMRSVARQIVEDADRAVIPPNVKRQEPEPKEQPNEQEK